MPTYEYICKSCGQRFETFQAFTARPLKVHDSCGGEVQRVLHARGVVFKGSGFYATDSRAPAPSSSETTTSSAAAD
jgi:putative FmdB family regulatory protein